MSKIAAGTLSERARDERLKRLLSYLAADPGNDSLRDDAADRALAAGEPEIVLELFEGIGREPTDRELNLAGIAYIQLKDFDSAEALFRRLLDKGVDDPAVTFNLAWSLAMSGDDGGALELLTNNVTAASPAAAMLEVRLLHAAGEFERAGEAARAHVAAYPDDRGLAAAVSVLALDIEDRELAKACAEKAAGHPDALSTLGTLALGEQRSGDAERLFDSALRANDQVPRAWIGRGLARMLAKDERAAADIDRGAELFADHIGSWIAAGWAYLVAGDPGTAKDRFERALAIDGNFAESHGSLAVVDVLEGREEAASKRIRTARRLDRDCFSAAFAQTLLAARSGQEDAARALFARILETPVNDRGETAAAALARLGLR